MSKHQRGENNPNFRRVTLVCPVCGKEFQTTPSHIRKYCSMECYNKVRFRKLGQEDLEETLRELYVERKLTTIEIGKRLSCDPKTVTYWMDKFGIPRRTPSEIFKMNNPAKRPDVKEKMCLAARERWKKPEEHEKASRAQRGKRLSEEHKHKISRSLIGNKRRKGIPHSEEIKKKIGEASKKNWRNPEYARKVITALQEKPNKFERKLTRMIKENNFPFKYVGDGQVVIDGQVPDFIAADGSRKVIELFGVPWHDPNHSKKIKVKYNRTEKAKHKFYESHDYELLVIWGYELKDEAGVLEKIKAFTKM